MEVLRGRPADSRSEQRASTFTGAVWVDPIVRGAEDVAVSTVNFSPGARSYWHSHDGGQVLYVTAGEGWVAERGKPPEPVRSGDTVWTPAGEEHWHGAGAVSFLVHIAVSLGEAVWLEEVREEDYPSAPRAAGH